MNETHVEQIPFGLYGRTSKDDQKRVTIEIQQQTLRDWSLRDPGVSCVYDEYMDKGVSGKLPLWERPEGQRLIADYESGKIKGVAVVYSDRFGRDVVSGLQAARELATRGIHLVVVSEGYDSRRETNQFLFTMRLAMAEEEHRRIRDRTAAGRARALREQGAPPDPVIYFGYLQNPERRGWMIPNPDEAPLVAEMFKMVLEGHTQLKILKRLMDARIDNPNLTPGRKYQGRSKDATPVVRKDHQQAEAWSPSTIGRILRNPLYATGERLWKGNKYKVAPPLVDQDTFDAVQLLLNDTGKSARTWRTDGTRCLLSGMLTCNLCGGTFHYGVHRSTDSKGRKYAYPYYLCENSRVTGHVCKAKKVPIADIDAFAWSKIEQYLTNPDRLVRESISSNTRLQKKETDFDKEDKSLAEKLRKIDDEIASILTDQQESDLPHSYVAPRLKAMNARRKEVIAAQHELAKEKAKVLLAKDDISKLSAFVSQFRDVLRNDLTVNEKAAIVRRFIIGGEIVTSGNGYRKQAELTLWMLIGGEVKIDAGSRRKLKCDPSVPEIAYDHAYATAPSSLPSM
jgi:site-specific DNA recombinase